MNPNYLINLSLEYVPYIALHVSFVPVIARRSLLLSFCMGNSKPASQAHIVLVTDAIVLTEITRVLSLTSMGDARKKQSGRHPRPVPTALLPPSKANAAATRYRSFTHNVGLLVITN